VGFSPRGYLKISGIREIRGSKNSVFSVPSVAKNKILKNSVAELKNKNLEWI